MMKRWLTFVVIALAATLANAQVPESPIVKAELVVDGPNAAAVTFRLPNDWHIYWKNPGDSGIETKLEWTLPEGVNAGEIEWPIPERIEMSGLANYGYSHYVTLPVALTARENASGDVKVKASWLVCKDICIPESVDLSAPLKPNADAAKIIATARTHVPVETPIDTRNWMASYTLSGKEITITLNAPAGATFERPAAAAFFPLVDGIIANVPAGRTEYNAETKDKIRFIHPRGNAELGDKLPGVIGFDHADGSRELLRIDVIYEGVPESAIETPVGEQPSPVSTTPLMTALVLAFLGGLILNIMPCVLPILALKALALSKKAAASRAAAAKQGFSYTGGVIFSFLVIASIMLSLKAGGAAAGWGFQLQEPIFVGFLMLVMLAVSANLLGLFELPVLFGARATGIDDSSARGSFATGVLAVLVATPCTAPFMATAVGATLSLPSAEALMVFASLGLGMASPFLLISLWPAARRLLPKPGAWMKRFKQLLAIPMLATAIWLGWVLMQVLNPTPVETSGITEAYSQSRLSELREQKKPVLVDATAAWCISCKVNERVAIKPEAMQQFFREKNMTILVADWTASDPAITKYLESFGRNGVPLYVYYAPGAEPKILPQVLTPSIVREAIETTN